MRLIDADKLREKLIIDYEVRETYFGEILLKEIDKSPTVENITVFCENSDEQTIEDLKAELQSVIEARPQAEWIPVSERLPDVGQAVIVTDDSGMVFQHKLNLLSADYTTNKWRFLSHEIIAWQPLPEPYKVGGEEE